MNFFQPKYVYCGKCRTAYVPNTVGPLCPQCNWPFSSVTGTIEGSTSFLTMSPSCLPIPKDHNAIILHIPGELKEAFITFLEVGLASVTVHMEELENDELQLVELLQSTIDRLEYTEPTPEEVLRRGRALLRGDDVIEI